ncbi:MAG: nucleotidyltransferase family protein [Ignavibacteria bacterium]|nr:nucleotidyltransferase family protein [Ignavibacteria bacterium]
MKISGLIIAAGLSGRMNAFKPILEVNGKPLIQIVIEKLSPACDDIVVVTGYKSDAIERVVMNLPGVKTLYNDEYEKGMFTSLKRGIKNLSNSDWVFYHFVDQPTIPDVFYKDFVQRINPECNWIQPSYKNAKGHPILIAKNIFNLIMNAADESSLKEISKNPEVQKQIWECDYPEVLEDIDTQEDFNNRVLQKGKSI